MNRRSLIAAALAGSLVSTNTVLAQVPPGLDPQNTLVMQLKDGTVYIKLRPDLAPKAVARMKELARQGFYDGTPFHRVIDGFMAQGGDPTGTGSGGSKLPNLPAEFTNNSNFLTGTVGMARTNDPDTANSQFFIMFKPTPSLDGKYTIVGQVVSGMQFVEQIKRGSGSSGSVTNPDKIVSMKVLADVH